VHTDRPIRVLVADDHTIVRAGVVSLLQSEPDFLVVGEASDGKEAMQLAEQTRPDIVVLDVTMPRLNGLTAAYHIRRALPEAGIVVLTVHADQPYVTQALAAGVRGYVLKQAVAAELAQAIRRVQRGEVYLSPETAALALDWAVPQDALASGEGLFDDLTLREVEVLQLIAEGLSNKEIAQQLDVSVKTIETHRTRLMTKLNIHETAGLVRYAIRKKIVQA